MSLSHLHCYSNVSSILHRFPGYHLSLQSVHVNTNQILLVYLVFPVFYTGLWRAFARQSH